MLEHPVEHHVEHPQKLLQNLTNLPKSSKKRILAPWMMPKNHDLNKIKQNTFCQKYANTKKALTISPFGNSCKTPKFQKLTKQTPPTYNIHDKKIISLYRLWYSCYKKNSLFFLTWILRSPSSDWDSSHPQKRSSG